MVTVYWSPSGRFTSQCGPPADSALQPSGNKAGSNSASCRSDMVTFAAAIVASSNVLFSVSRLSWVSLDFNHLFRCLLEERQSPV